MGERKAAWGSSSFNVLCIKADLQSRKTLISHLVSLPTKYIYKWYLSVIVALPCATLTHDAEPDCVHPEIKQKCSWKYHQALRSLKHIPSQEQNLRAGRSQVHAHASVGIKERFGVILFILLTLPACLRLRTNLKWQVYILSSEVHPSILLELILQENSVAWVLQSQHGSCLKDQLNCSFSWVSLSTSHTQGMLTCRDSNTWCRKSSRNKGLQGREESG